MSEQNKEPILTACACGARDADECPGSWEPGCDLGNNAEHVRRVDSETKAQIDNAVTMDEVERLRIQLAGCGVAALSNTRESLQRIKDISTDAPGWSCSLMEVVRAVEREIALREVLEQHEQDFRQHKVCPACKMRDALRRTTPDETVTEAYLSWMEHDADSAGAGGNVIWNAAVKYALENYETLSKRT